MVPADRLAGEVDALADPVVRVPPDVIAPTKLMLNRAMEAAGFLDAVAVGRSEASNLEALGSI